ncbi:MAG: PadR family transcriptional regulator [Bacteroidota bacterium]
MKGTSLGEFEELCLLAVGILQEDAYGVSVKEQVEKHTGRKSTLSTVHSTLIRLEKKGFLESKMGGATELRGGRTKRIFQITPLGKKSMNEARELRSRMWDHIPKILWEGGAV